MSRILKEGLMMTHSVEDIRPADNLDSRNCFHRLWSRVAQHHNYVPRDYQTIGGMWTVDLYRLGEVECLLMDEGWTQVIRAPGLKVNYSGSSNEPVFIEGNEELLARLATND